MQPLWAFGIEIWPYPTACGIQCWDTRVQTTNQEGCSTSDQRTAYPKNFLNPQPPLHMPLDTPLHTRGPRPSSTHQWAGSNSFHQEDVMSLQTSLIHHGAVTRGKKSMVLQPANWVWVWKHWSEPAVEPAGPWALVMRGDCTAVIHRKSPTEGDFSKVKKHNSPT